MGAIVNGLTLHYLRGYGASFLIFSDYMKAAIRLAALMRIPSIFVFTHDSIGLGEDGPTHQPIEQLVTLRATPNLYVVRPAGANETALAWRFAIAQTRPPTAMALSRQGLPIWDPAGVPDDAIQRGAYILRESATAASRSDPDRHRLRGPRLQRAGDLLEADGIGYAPRERAVPRPLRGAGRRLSRHVLPPAVRARVAVEAAARSAGTAGSATTATSSAMEGFGASAPQPGALRALRLHAARTSPNARGRCSRRVEGEAWLMQTRLHRPRQDGRQHGPSHPARLGPRGRRVGLQRGRRCRRPEANGAAGARLARGPGREARAAAARLDDGPRGRADSSRRSRRCSSCSTTGDLIVDGGNSKWTRLEVRRAAALDERGIQFVDVGHVSGGVWGLEVGYCMMVGGSEEAVDAARPGARRARPAGRLGPLGRRGRGPLREDGAQRRRVRDHAGLRRGLRADAHVDFPTRARGGRAPLEAGLGRALVAVRAGRAGVRGRGQRPRRAASGHVADSGEGRWTIADAIDNDVPTPVMAAVAVRALLLARRGRLHRTGAGRAARTSSAATRSSAPRAGAETDGDVENRDALPSPRRTRSSRGSSACRSRPRRSSSSAPPATSRTASCSPRSTTSRTRARCPSASS